jgi:hypothetical protein
LTLPSGVSVKSTSFKLPTIPGCCTFKILLLPTLKSILIHLVG